jgi:hypothetical protein
MSFYKFPDETVLISYSSGQCEEGLPYGWRVPNDTVTEISLNLFTEQKLADVLVPGKEYRKIYAAHTTHVFYVDSDEGIQFTVLDDMVQRITYAPAKKDEHLACGETKYAVPVTPGAKLNSIEHYPFDVYGGISFEDAKARLDNFVIQLFELKKKDPLWRGYIVVYAGRRSYIGEAQYRANCFKNYLVRVRGMDAANLFAVDGGFRNELQVQLFLGRADSYPPVLMPEISPKKVTVFRRRLRNCAQGSP